MNTNKIKVMVNGLPGNMASLLTAKILKDERFELVLRSLTGPWIKGDKVEIDGREIELISPDERHVIPLLKDEHGQFISVDFTQPSAANANAHLYCLYDLPFVMGTTGGDRQQLNETVKASSIAAVIAPNMAKQIVGFQAMMEYAAVTFPGLFAGHSLEITESHQQAKSDTSGTAKAVVKCFNGLGIQFTEDQIVKERDPRVQRSWVGVPAQYLNGHGWHTYTLVSPDETVKLEFVHNVNGRDVYVVGALEAVLFLAKRVSAGAKGQVFSMIDVLKG